MRWVLSVLPAFQLATKVLNTRAPKIASKRVLRTKSLPSTHILALLWDPLHVRAVVSHIHRAGGERIHQAELVWPRLLRLRKGRSGNPATR
eukprot:scaffold228061_cov34-Tisochrysis_lutea.AAC.2